MNKVPTCCPLAAPYTRSRLSLLTDSFRCMDEKAIVWVVWRHLGLHHSIRQPGPSAEELAAARQTKLPNQFPLSVHVCLFAYMQTMTGHETLLCHAPASNGHQISNGHQTYNTTAHQHTVPQHVTFRRSHFAQACYQQTTDFTMWSHMQKITAHRHTWGSRLSHERTTTSICPVSFLVHIGMGPIGTPQEHRVTRLPCAQPGRHVTNGGLLRQACLAVLPGLDVC
jgi:hypothetical protein